MSTNKETFKYLENFLNRDGISGYEADIANAYIEETKKHGAKIDRDGFGSVIATIGTASPKLMIAAHMDEVGFMVQQITKEGMLRITEIGGHWVHTILAMEVKVTNRDGKQFHGVVGSTNIHILPMEARAKVMDIKDVYVDLGFNSKEEVIAAGINVGDPVVRVGKAQMLGDGDKYMAKAIDDRVGVAIIAKVIENLKGASLKCQLNAVATAQEEVGLRGSRATVQKIAPDVAIAIDTTSSHDIPNVIPGDTKLGHGVAITFKDNTALANPRLANTLFDIANEKKIPVYKFVSQGGGNDSGSNQYSQGGIPVVTIAVPTRYLHTPFEVGSIKDFNAVVELITEFVKRFDEKMHDSFKYK